MYECYCYERIYSDENQLDICYKCNPEINKKVSIIDEKSTIYSTYKDIYLQNEQNIIELSCEIFDDIYIKHRRKNRICCAFTCLYFAKYIIYEGIGSIQYINSLEEKNIDKRYILDRKNLHFKIYNIRLNIQSLSKHVMLNPFDYYHVNDVILNVMYLIKFNNFNISSIDIYNLKYNCMNNHIDVGVAICILFFIKMNKKEYIKSIYSLNNKNRYKITIDCNFLNTYTIVNNTLNIVKDYSFIDMKCIKCKSNNIFKETGLCLKHSIYEL